MENGKTFKYPISINLYMVQCPSPQASPYDSKTGCAKGGGQNDKEMHRDIHIQQKRKKKKRGEKKNQL
jgi:hypothetical protein